MIFPVFPWMYATASILLVLAWPHYIDYPNLALSILTFTLNISIFVATTWSVSSSDLSFWRGLRLLCGSYESGCANITVIYIFPLLLFYYIKMIWITWMSFQKGKFYAENWWIETISNRLNPTK
jgi:hypothetical protein